MRVRDEYADLPDVDVPIRQVQVDAHWARQPPDDGAGARAGIEMVDMPEADAFVTLVVEDHRRLDRAILQDLDLRVALRFGRARGHLDIGSHLRVEDDRRGRFACLAGELRCVLSCDTICVWR